MFAASDYEAYGSPKVGTLENCALPRPLLVPCAAPMFALRLWPLQVAVVLDITLQHCKLASGASLEVMPVRRCSQRLTH
jgi:hypothetical protein